MSYRKISGRPTESLERELDNTIFGGDMKIGTHVVTLADIEIKDTSALMTFKNTFNETFKQNMFYFNYSKTDLAYIFKQLVASVVEEPTELWEIQSDPRLIKSRVGSTVRLEIGDNGGTTYKVTTEGFTSGDLVAPTLTELRELLVAKDLKIYRKEIRGIYT